jgi:hypothetical protein
MDLGNPTALQHRQYDVERLGAGRSQPGDDRANHREIGWHLGLAVQDSPD